MDQAAFLDKQANLFILKTKIDRLPVDVFTLAKSSGCLVLTFLEYSLRTGIPLEEIKKRYSKKGFAFYSEREGAYVICYNSFLSTNARRWIVMHELMHIECGHLTPRYPYISYGGISPRWMEEEAEGMCARVLCPAAVLWKCGALAADLIAELCGLSETEALRVQPILYRHIEHRRFLKESAEIQVLAQFRSFIETFLDAGFSKPV